MKATIRFFLIIPIVISSATIDRNPGLSRAQSDQSGTPFCGQPDETAPRQIEFPYYSLRDGFNSTLLLVSASPKPLDFVIAVRGLAGQTVLANLSIQPQEKLAVDLRKLLTDLSADVLGDFAEGSVSVYFSGTIMPLPAQLTMTNPARRLILESEMMDNSPGLNLLPRELNALWWGIGGGRDARIMVSNTGGEPATADVFLDFLGKRHPSTPVTFGAHETKVLSITQLLGDLKVSPAQAPEGGITIVPRGPKATLIAQGKITDPVTGFSTSLNFPDPSLQLASALHASGVPIGTPTQDSPYAGTGTFLPHVIARNLTGVPQSVSITIEYPAPPPAEQPEKGENVEAPPPPVTEQTVLPPVLLGPYTTHAISLEAAFGLLPLPLPFCSIRIQYSGSPGSVIGEVSSIEQRGDLVIDSRLANEGDGWAGSGGHPWHLDEETESVLFLTNMGEKECPIGFRMQAEGVHYFLTDLKLAPHETRVIDLRKLRDGQKPDFQGNRIPILATDGTVLWIRGDLVPVMGRLVVLRRHKGMASNYDCGYCPCPYIWANLTLRMDPSDHALVAGSTKQYKAKADFYDCNFVLYPSMEVTTCLTTWWSSSNTRVATVNTLGQKGLVKGENYGTATIGASYGGCLYYLYNPFNVPPCSCNSPATAMGFATVRVNYGCNDQRDQIIQEYHDYKTSPTNPFYPLCGNFTQTAHSYYFTFANLNTGNYSWALVKRPLVVAASSGYGLDKWREEYGGPGTITSAYRNPVRNNSVGGKRDSRHLFGDAADLL